MSHEPFDPFSVPGPPGSGAPGEPGAEREPTAEERAAAESATAAWRALRDGLGAASTTASHGGELQCVELCPICRAADILRASGPPELRGQLTEFQREALMTLRALLDHYIDRLEPQSDPSERVEDIPIG
jgi:hypothetical protein